MHGSKNAVRRLSLAALISWLVVLALFAPARAVAQTQSFAAWLEDFRREALQSEIREVTLDAAFVGIEPIPRIIELDRRQPEVTQTFSDYIRARVTSDLVAEGRAALERHQSLLEAVGDRYGVPPRFIVALWGVETRYGKHTGGYPVIGALATLAHDARRASYFRRELLNALRILDEGHISPGRMKGSWAGAMGQNQFMPSSFLTFAVDHDQDGRRDIWTTLADVFASTANYLARSGWKRGHTWGREARLPAGFDPALVGRKVTRTLAQWQALGVRRADGRDLPVRELPASVILPGGDGGPAFLVYHNYGTILKWNRSDYFGVSVGFLADRIGAQ